MKPMTEVQAEGTSMQDLQERVFDADFDYRARSPHFKHPQLHAKLLAHLRDALSRAAESAGSATLLEVGAGDGGFVEPALAYGYGVTATEMSRPVVARLEELYGANRAFEAILDEDGSLSPLGTRRFSAILFASVLHHIPDYMSTIETAISRHLEPGGALITFHDPLWYPSVSRSVRWFGEIAFLSWRLTQGNYRQGIQTRVRRMRHVYDDLNPADTVEYHVVRDGVAHHTIYEWLSGRFRSVELFEYWASGAGVWQRLGEMMNVTNTFGTIALDYSGDPA